LSEQLQDTGYEVSSQHQQIQSTKSINSFKLCG
jgi:hypothetical protein